MAITTAPRLRAEDSSERDTPDGVVYTRVYEIAFNDTLADVSLERGDVMPSVTGSEILSAVYLPIDKPGNSRRVKVEAIIWRAWSA